MERMEKMKAWLDTHATNSYCNNLEKLTETEKQSMLNIFESLMFLKDLNNFYINKHVDNLYIKSVLDGFIIPLIK